MVRGSTRGGSSAGTGCAMDGGATGRTLTTDRNLRGGGTPARGQSAPEAQTRSMVIQMARTHTYTVQKGDKVLPEFVGTKVDLTQYDTIADAVKAGHFESERAVMDAANAQRNIAANRVVRKALSKKDASVAGAVTLANAVKIGAATARGTPATAKPKTIQKNVAASSGNRLFEKCLADEGFLARMVKQGVADEGEYKTWLAARNAPAPTAAPAAAATVAK